MQIIISFACFMHIINYVVCNVVHIWREILLRLEILGKNDPHGLTIIFKVMSIWILTHWGRVTHICVGTNTNIGSDNGLSPGRRQVIIWTNAGIFLIGTLETNLNEILIEIRAFSFTKIDLKMSSVKWRPFCLGLNELMIYRTPGLKAPRKVSNKMVARTQEDIWGMSFPLTNAAWMERTTWSIS